MRRPQAPRSTLARGLGLVAVLLVGCEGEGAEGYPPPPELPFTYASEHFELHSDVERCAGDLASWEGFFEFAAAYLELAPPDSVPVYVWESHSFDGIERCGFEAGGCFRDAEGVVYASASGLEHELLHVLARDTSSPDSFFQEGLAEALSGPTQFGKFGPSFPVSGSTQVDYTSAGHFVRWLLETQGLEPLLVHMNGDGSVAAFEHHYGQPLDDIVALYFAEAPLRYPALYQHPWPELEARAEGLWSSELQFACAHEDVRAGREGRELLRTLTLPEPGTYAFWSTTGERIRGRLEQSADEALAHEGALLDFVFPGGALGLASLPAGTYELAILAPSSRAPAEGETESIWVWASEATVPVFPGDPP